MKTAAPRAPASATMGASIGACDALVDAQETAGHYGVQSTTCLLPFSWAGGLHVTGLSCVSSFPRDSWRRGSSVRSAPSPSAASPLTQEGSEMANLATEVKLYGRWSFEDVEVKDISLEDYIACKPKYAQFLPHSPRALGPSPAWAMQLVQ